MSQSFEKQSAMQWQCTLYVYIYVKANNICDMNEYVLYLKQWSTQVICLEIYNKMMYVNLLMFVRSCLKMDFEIGKSFRGTGTRKSIFFFTWISFQEQFKE